MSTAYASPKTALSQPSVAPLRVGLRETLWLRKEVRASAAEASICTGTSVVTKTSDHISQTPTNSKVNWGINRNQYHEIVTDV
eukprot:2293939-Rhodomonas_salina.3